MDFDNKIQNNTYYFYFIIGKPLETMEKLGTVTNELTCITSKINKSDVMEGRIRQMDRNTNLNILLNLDLNGKLDLIAICNCKNTIITVLLGYNFTTDVKEEWGCRCND